MDINPSWKQLAQIPESPTKSQVLRALGVTPPPEGFSSTFRVSDAEEVIRTDQGFVHWTGRRSLFLSGDELLQQVKLFKGTPLGDCFRVWLRIHGWVPKSERSATEPQDATRVII